MAVFDERESELLDQFLTLVYGQDADLIYESRLDEVRVVKWVKEDGHESSKETAALLRRLADDPGTDLDLAWALRRDWGIGFCQDPLTAESVRPWLRRNADAIDAELASGEA